MQRVVSVSLILVGIVHLLPVNGVWGAQRLELLYGVTLDEPNLVMLMRHRAALFGVLGAVLIYAAWRPSLQPVAWSAAMVSVVSFLVLAWRNAALNSELARVAWVDVTALAVLLVAACAWGWLRWSAPQVSP